MYGRKRPHAVPIAELAILNKATKMKSDGSEKKCTIPKAEKRKIVSEEPEGKPVDFSGAIEARAVMPAEVPDYFSTSAVPSPIPMPSTSERYFFFDCKFRSLFKICTIMNIFFVIFFVEFS